MSPNPQHRSTFHLSVCASRPRLLPCLISLLLAPSAWAGGEQSVERVVVTASTADAQGVSDAASVGTVTRQQIEARAVYRPGELLESTPGLIVSQHSGEGKANQFYLRGFNLDHGTDLRTTVDGMLVNQRTHSHGQGWTDLNFIIPELAAGLEYRKGPYFAAEGDFSSAGSVHLKYVDKLPRGIAELAAGQNGYRRGLLADSTSFRGGNLLYAMESMHNDGPFTRPDDYRKLNAVLRYSRGDEANGFRLSAMAYRARWDSTDQIPRRALEQGLLGSRFDTIDTTDGGEAHRYSLSGAWQSSSDRRSTRVDGWIAGTRLDLFSNFTYFLTDPVNGDQFGQPDKRTTAGLNVRHTRLLGPTLPATELSVGVQLQNDNIFNALTATRARETLATVRRDHVLQTSVGTHLEASTRWNEHLRTVAGFRGDFYRSQVQSDLAANSGRANDHIINPKLSVIAGPWRGAEFYLNFGGGFHSNDARGTTINIDPATGEPAAPVSPLVRSRGGEIGVRTSLIPGLQTSLVAYRLDFDSELVFVGDAGTTEASRPSRRTGIELANYYRLGKWLTLDADIAFSRARFRDDDPAGRRIPGAVEGVASTALSIDHPGGWSGALQWRYFGPRPLIEDNSVRSSSTAQFNGRIGYRVNRDLKLELEGFNLGNRKASSIDYFYQSRLRGEQAEGHPDVHFHPLESRSFRFSVGFAFR
ncbi:MAG: TonB-dependent receptor [Betaproteobacteria bacterium]|nr:TonB-dependent receptor [Betaproteobacteria bacterium]